MFYCSTYVPKKFLCSKSLKIMNFVTKTTSKILKENLKIFDFYAVLFRKLKNQKSAILGPIFLKLFRNLSTGTCLLYKNSPTETLKDINIQDRDWNGCPW